jgi:hypothetical protein
MPEVKSNALMSPSLPDVVETAADTDSPLNHDAEEKGRWRQRWRELIDHQLIEWGRTPDALEDEGVEAPSPAIVRQAIQVAQGLSGRGSPPPDFVTIDPNGGIVFERRENGTAEVVHVWEDGIVEYCRFQGRSLVARRAL